MFQDVGKELKARAKGYVIWKTIEYVVIGALLAYLVIEAIGLYDRYYLVVLVAAIFGWHGYSTSREKAMMQYAFGELLDNVKQIRTEVCGTGRVAPSRPRDDTGRRVEIGRTGQQGKDWRCTFCGFQNPAGASNCQGCGSKPL